MPEPKINKGRNKGWDKLKVIKSYKNERQSGVNQWLINREKSSQFSWIARSLS